MKKLGPYIHKRNGYIYFVEIDNGKRKIVYEHREIIERKLGRKLNNDEVVHHINEIKTDNREENLEVKSWSSHSAHHARELTVLTLECAECKVQFNRDARQRKENKGYTNSFCSRRCSGIYNRRNQ